MQIARGRWTTELALIALALALRVAFAPGFMAAPTVSGAITVTLCTGTGPVQIAMPLPGKAPMPMNQAHDPCPYGALAVPPLAPEAPLLAAVAFIVPFMPAIGPLLDRPHLGVPAPPPPATGPPIPA